MKAKTKGKKQRSIKSRKAKPTAVNDAMTAMPTATGGQLDHDGPSPEALLEMAQQEPSLVDMWRYLESIRVLRRKGYSFREIAAWLSAAGVPTNHNTVYRIFKQSMGEGEREIFEEAEEARMMHELGDA